jgi:membrane protein DedA with SNARE-associated domain
VSVLSIVLPILVVAFLILFVSLIIWWMRRRTIRKRNQSVS